MTVSIWQAAGRQSVQEADIAVIGAGLLGCTAALFFRQAGYTVTILEARDIALGASGRNAGFIITGLDKYYHLAEEKYGPKVTREAWTLSKQTHQFWLEVARKHNVFVEQSGSLLLAESKAEALDLEQAARRMDTVGLTCEFLPKDPLDRGYYAAIRQPGDGGLHPYDLTCAIFADSGADIITNSEVYALESEETSVLVRSRKTDIRVQKVLLCTNAYSIYLDSFFIGKIIPNRAQCLATAPLPERLVNGVGYSDYGYMYYRDLPDGGLLVGGGRKQNKQLESNTTDDHITQPVQKILEDYLRQKFPEAAEIPIVRRWAGIMGFTPDGLPIVGTLSRDKRIGFAVGLNGHGLGLGAKVAERAVDHLLNGSNPGIFDANRL